MKASRLTKIGAAAIAMAALSLAFGGRLLPGQPGIQAALAAEKTAKVSGMAMVPLGLPSEDTAKALLDSSIAYHHPQWIDVPMGTTKIHTFVIYPTLSGTAPAVVVTVRNEGLSDWARAVGTEVVKQGYIAIVPDLLSGLGPNGGGTYSFANKEAIAAALGQLSAAEIQRRADAVRDYFVSQPGSNGKSAILDFNWSESRIDAAISTPTQRRLVQFNLTEHAWHNTLALLTTLADPGAMPQEDSGMPKPKDDSAEAASAARERAAAQEIAKRKDIVPGHFGGPLKVRRTIASTWRVDQHPCEALHRHGEDAHLAGAAARQRQGRSHCGHSAGAGHGHWRSSKKRRRSGLATRRGRSNRSARIHRAIAGFVIGSSPERRGF